MLHDVKYIFFTLALILCLSGNARAVELHGEMTQGGFIVGRTEVGAQITLDGTPIRQTNDGYFAFGFHRDQSPNATLKITHPSGRGEVHPLTITSREYDVQRIDKLPSKMVTPPEGVWERIAADQRDVKEARKHDSDTPFYMEGFIVPAEGIISGVYGSQRILNGKPKQPHYGVDYAAPTGTPVYAPAAGIVRLAHEDMYYTGKTIIIDHGHEITSTLMHMDSLNVAVGDKVAQGDLIGTIGATGRATGPHLDWRMNWKSARIDPQKVLDTWPTKPAR
jgi:hypothetical protein